MRSVGEAICVTPKEFWWVFFHRGIQSGHSWQDKYWMRRATHWLQHSSWGCFPRAGELGHSIPWQQLNAYYRA